ncbi:hypothetical protein [Micromonospora sp. NPDC005173]|uniref:hypothetical protein n=1 Tax=Micromonospora sp. NPDC005173 TaxID=3157165 RepID=UPI00339E52E3
MYEEEVLDEIGLLQALQPTVGEIVASISTSDAAWVVPSEPIDLGEVAWLPSLVKESSKDIMYVHLAAEMRPYLLRRLRAAKSDGWKVHVAVDFLALSDTNTVLALGELDAYVHLIKGNAVQAGGHVLTVLSDESVPVEQSVRSALAKATWGLRDDGTKQEKGRRLEALLAFLLGQVDDFIVKEKNFRGDTDEIDIILQLSKVSARCWYNSSAPFILVESKNWVDPVPQKEISAFIFKLQTKRGRSKIGLFFSKGGYTSDAEQQELKLAATDLVVVLIGPDEIVEWISHEDPDDYLESKVRHSMLR